MVLVAKNPPRKKKWPRGRRKLLKRLVSDKGIQGYQSLFLGRIWPRLWSAWLDFDKFGIGFEKANFSVFIQARLAAGCECAVIKRTTSGWWSLDSIPKSTLEAPAPRRASVFLKDRHRGRPRGHPSSQVEYR
jgi:hypothetical protein